MPNVAVAEERAVFDVRLLTEHLLPFAERGASDIETHLPCTFDLDVQHALQEHRVLLRSAFGTFSLQSAGGDVGETTQHVDTMSSAQWQRFVVAFDIMPKVMSMSDAVKVFHALAPHGTAAAAARAATSDASGEGPAAVHDDELSYDDFLSAIAVSSQLARDVPGVFSHAPPHQRVECFLEHMTASNGCEDINRVKGRPSSGVFMTQYDQHLIR